VWQALIYLRHLLIAGQQNMPKSTAPKRRRSPPKISAIEKTAVRIMRKLYEATGGQPQRWESLGNLGAVKSDAAGIAYAIKKGWLIGVGEPPHSVCLTEAGRSLVDRR
jgi:hypothetical protein